ncbi:MAG: zinc dependent phospholipase C family protein, partial [Clostridia bacterium]|nr:zinc dependent phospholipase C family protein [Clostridia bacterium]
MPASYVHQSVALSAAREAGLHLSDLTQSAYLTGCEGPDPLFCGFICSTPSVQTPSAGIMMHREETETFLCALRDTAKTPVQQAYFYGFLTHYAADTIFHPFVYGHSLKPDGTYSSDLHGIIEQAYELVRYRRDAHPVGIPRQLAGIEQMPDRELRECTALFADAMQNCYTRNVLSPERVFRTFRAGVRTARALSSPSGRKYQLAGRLRPFHLNLRLHAHMIPSEFPREDIWNDGHLPWFSLFEPERIRHESMDDLYETAVTRAARLLCAAAPDSGCTGDACVRLLGGLSYESGLPWRDTPTPDAAARLLR